MRRTAAFVAVPASFFALACTGTASVRIPLDPETRSVIVIRIEDDRIAFSGADVSSDRLSFPIAAEGETYALLFQRTLAVQMVCSSARRSSSSKEAA